MHCWVAADGLCVWALCTCQRVSGDWLVWACRFPARAATAPFARLFKGWPKLRVCLDRCWFPVLHTHREGMLLGKYHVSPLCCAARDCGAGWTSKHLPCSATRAPRCVPRSSAHSYALDLSDAEDRMGTRSRRPLSCPENKRSTLHADDDRSRFGRALATRFKRRPVSMRNATWLILPVVICLSQRLSHACVSMN